MLVTLAEIAELPKEYSTLLGSQVAPFGTRFESCSGRCHCGVNVFLSGGFDFCDDGFVIGVDGLDFLAGSGGDELVVDEETFAVLVDIGSVLSLSPHTGRLRVFGAIRRRKLESLSHDLDCRFQGRA